eukprot:CAMPEP_0177526016 /NCGR_PEP_ID=MMETSP0369-20130122/50859_1 /TAXON_ID=447022 ORGANISM="Scrippsiella hangoei-like, Strain SHHI-4" /NCGR_SAMPLE_ID=MMETSP0369 /ASSEMBLY_ACC=CAM_ASM_000364 /LENGTH=36 /DNA_ID= /DNA_START= /DNA_END= /DNA_ORIENTATION=
MPSAASGSATSSSSESNLSSGAIQLASVTTEMQELR